MRVILGLLALVGLAGPGLRPADAAAVNDRLIVVLDAGVDGWYGEVSFEGTVTGAAGDSTVVGFVSSTWDRTQAMYEPMLVEVPPDGLEVAVTGPADETLTLIPSAGGQGYTVRLEATAYVQPRERVVLVFFVAGAASVDVSPQTTTVDGAASIAIEEGSGSHLLRARDGDGFSVETGYSAATATSIDRNVPSGIVGGFVGACNGCVRTFISPDGRSRSSRTISPHADTMEVQRYTLAFAGPSGEWRWSMEGVDVRTRSSRGVIGAYTDVGDRWRDFVFGFTDNADFGGDGVDWVLVTLTAGPDGAEDSSLFLDVDLHDAGEGDVYFGYGRAHGKDAWVDVDLWDDEVVAVRTSGVPVEEDRTLRGPDIDPMGYGIFTGTPELGPGEATHILLFAAGATITDGRIDGGSDHLTLTLDQGSGSETIKVLRPGSDQFAAQAGVATIGDVEHADTLPAGIVGALGFECRECEAGWRAPDGREGSFSTSCTFGCLGRGERAFWGPGGTWQWRWEGTDTYAANIGAYAPVGEAWRLFAQADAYPADFGGPDVDWVAAVVRTGLDDADVLLEGVIEPTGEGPLVFGVGFAVDAWYVEVDLRVMSQPGTVIRSSESLGGIEYVLEPTATGAFRFYVGFGGTLRERNEHAVVPFVVGGVITRGWVDRLEHAEVTITEGSGSALLLAFEGDTGSHVVQAGQKIVGRAGFQRSVADGLIGGFDLCGTCVVSWASPDGRAETRELSPYSLPPMFYGPEGTWAWEWTGTGSGQLIGAYAPVGEVWRLFQDHAEARRR